MKGQVWLETVIYTLIGLSILGVILALVTPKIQETKDKAVIDQSLSLLDDLSRTIDEIKFVPGNSWPVQLKFEKGVFVVDGEGDEVYFLFEDSKVAYSEIGETITRGKITIETTRAGKEIKVKLSLRYANALNITSRGEDQLQRFQSAALPYDLFVENVGRDGNGFTVINFHS